MERTMNRKKFKPLKGDPHSPYHKVWRQVDGIVRQTFEAHPEYLTETGKKNARLSLTKRLVGQLAVRGMGDPDRGKSSLPIQKEVKSDPV
jgi:hypothetical protein